MEPGLIWVLAGVLLLVAELVLPGAFLVWAGLAAAGAGTLLLVAAPGHGAAPLVFLALLGCGVSVGLRRRRRSRPPRPGGDVPGSGLIGRTGTLLPAGGPGLRVRLGDAEWPARLPRDQRVPEGPVPVRVEGVDGGTLLVRPE